jgi:hypothetical protein
MFPTRLKNSLFVAIAAPFLFLLIAYSIDYTRDQVPEGASLLHHWSYWSAYLALSALFAASTLLYTWYLFTVLQKHRGVPIAYLILTIVIFLYPRIMFLLPFSVYPLHRVPFLFHLHFQLGGASPSSFLSIAALIVGLGAILTLRRNAKQVTPEA